MTNDKPIRWGDAQQYDAEPHPGYGGPEVGVEPSVDLLWMTPDPLGAIVAMSSMYVGDVVRDMSVITDAQREKALDDVQKTHLKAPLEAIKMHFMIDGVDRSFTHQHVRQRTAVFAQESLRFAIPGTLAMASTLPPSLAGTHTPDDPADGYLPSSKEAQRNRDVWEGVINHVDAAYHALVEGGMPAEEARGLLPHATATRMNYITDMRNMSDHAGNRLCTQAQFHWRKVFALLVKGIAEWTPDFSFLDLDADTVEAVTEQWEVKNRWQFEAIAASGLFRPVCYQLGYCPFTASFDRACSIRERVTKLGGAGVPSSEWHKQHVVPGELVMEGPDNVDAYFKAEPVDGIRTTEWMLDPSAARI